MRIISVQTVKPVEMVFTLEAAEGLGPGARSRRAAASRGAPQLISPERFGPHCFPPPSAAASPPHSRLGSLVLYNTQLLV